MKKLIFLALTLSSFIAFACGDNEIESDGGSTNDGQSFTQTSSGLTASFSGDAEIECVNLPPITVTGFAYFSIQRLVIGITYALNYSGGGGGSGFADLKQQDGCHNITGDDRLGLAVAAFVFARSQAVGINARLNFAEKYKPGSTFELTFPDGSIARFEVGAYNTTAPLVAEKSNSCQ